MGLKIWNLNNENVIFYLRFNSVVILIGRKTWVTTILNVNTLEWRKDTVERLDPQMRLKFHPVLATFIVLEEHMSGSSMVPKSKVLQASRWGREQMLGYVCGTYLFTTKNSNQFPMPVAWKRYRWKVELRLLHPLLPPFSFG